MAKKQEPITVAELRAMLHAHKPPMTQAELSVALGLKCYTVSAWLARGRVPARHYYAIREVLAGRKLPWVS